VLTRVSPEGTVAVRVTEVEAYSGEGDDPGSHAHRGRTRRNEVMFGPSGHLYTYFTYGMHTCGNIVCRPDGTAAGLLLRGGEVVEGVDLARARRGDAVPDRDLARGPARLAVALGILLADGGSDVFAGDPYSLEFPAHPRPFATSPRTGVSGEGGTDRFPWRFYVPDEPTVSPYRKAVARKRTPRVAG
jgi:DNA-3-methyladenine glycosylase